MTRIELGVLFAGFAAVACAQAGKETPVPNLEPATPVVVPDPEETSYLANLQQLTFEGGKEALAEGVVPSVTHRVNFAVASRANGKPHTSLSATLPEGERGEPVVLSTVVVDSGRAALSDSYLQVGEHQHHGQVIRHGPPDHPPAP